ncbi:MAG: hypothetical protein K2L14_05725 [Duncaniella sp.]|nr:hypothetical protein [Duncaniella sp.]
MTQYTDTDSLTLHYAEVFDFYLEERKLPPGTDHTDALLEPLTDIADDYRDLAETGTEMGEAIRAAANTVMGELVDQFADLDSEAEGELQLIDRFENASLEDKRAMWQQVKSTIEHGYSVLDVNLPGYIEQFATEDREAVFAALIGDWREACQAKIDRLRQSIISSRKQQIKIAVGNLATADMEERREVAALSRKYPVIEELAREIGRARTSPSLTVDSVFYRFLPSSVSRNDSGKEIDAVVTGCDVSRVLPAELSMPDDVFDHKFVARQLQQFDSRSKNDPRRTEEHRPAPRLTKGPIIVAVDTSASMKGQRMKVAFAAVRQLVAIAAAEHRPCYLISFSIRAKTIDLACHRNRIHLTDFLNDHYTGGTSGEEMLSKAIAALHTDTYEMADVLIISDLQFDRPYQGTLMAIQKEQALGTRFHALQIGESCHLYNKILDRIWQIKA